VHHTWVFRCVKPSQDGEILNSTPGRGPNGVPWHPSVPISFVVHPYEFWITRQTSQLVTFLKRMWTTVKTSVAQAADMGPHFRAIDTYFPPQIPQAGHSIRPLSRQSPGTWLALDGWWIWTLPRQVLTLSQTFAGQAANLLMPRNSCGKGLSHSGVMTLTALGR
jgi:hypothetical protein